MERFAALLDAELSKAGVAGAEPLEAALDLPAARATGRALSAFADAALATASWDDRPTRTQLPSTALPPLP